MRSRACHSSVVHPESELHEGKGDGSGKTQWDSNCIHVHNIPWFGQTRKTTGHKHIRLLLLTLLHHTGTSSHHYKDMFYKANNETSSRLDSVQL